MLLMYFSINFNFYIVNKILTKQKYCALHALAISHFFRLQFYLSPNPSYTGKTSDIKKNSWKLQRKSVLAKKKIDLDYILSSFYLIVFIALVPNDIVITSLHVVRKKKCQNIIAVRLFQLQFFLSIESSPLEQVMRIPHGQITPNFSQIQPWLQHAHPLPWLPYLIFR